MRLLLYLYRKLLAMKTLLSLLSFLITLTLYSQKTIDVGKNDLPNTSGSLYAVGGQPFANYKYVKVMEGTPYFKEEWMGGKVIMSGGFAYDSIYLRLDLMENSLHYIGPDGQEMIANSPIRGIILADSVTGKKYRFVNADYLQVTGKIAPGWYQMLDTGQVTLYKKFLKVINESRPYGSATTEQRIATMGQYFLMINSVFTPVKKIKEIPDLLPDKKEELKAYISLKNLSGKNDADYSALISYYNSIVAK